MERKKSIFPEKAVSGPEKPHTNGKWPLHKLGKMLLLSCLEAALCPTAHGLQQLSPQWGFQVQLEGLSGSEQ